jgi:hypothetical protein
MSQRTPAAGGRRDHRSVCDLEDIMASSPQLGEAQAKTTRQIPVSC